MKVKDWVIENMSTLEHFIEQGAWPIRLSGLESTGLEVMLPEAFKTKDGVTTCNVKKIPNKVLAIFYKIKYEEAQAEANKLYSIIQEAAHKADS